MLSACTWPWCHPPKHRKIRVNTNKREHLFFFSVAIACQQVVVGTEPGEHVLFYTVILADNICADNRALWVHACNSHIGSRGQYSIALIPTLWLLTSSPYILFNSIPRVLAGQGVGFIKMSYLVLSSQSLFHSTLTNYTPALIAYSWGEKEVPMTKVDGYQVYQDNLKYLEGNLTARPLRKYQ